VRFILFYLNYNTLNTHPIKSRFSFTIMFYLSAERNKATKLHILSSSNTLCLSPYTMIISYYIYK